MNRHALLGLVLALATSCAPTDRPASDHARVVQQIGDRELVRRLAPDLPDAALAALAKQPAVEALAERATVTAAPAFVGTPATTADAARATECLTAAVYYEARSETRDGQRAVAQVVLNRVRDRAFPHSVCGVVYQGVGRGRGCQFSFACDGSTNRPRDPWAWRRAEEVAAEALNGGVYAPVGTATFYHTNAVSPWWAPSLTRLGVIGAHIFYRWPGRLERALGFAARYAGVEPGTPSLVDAPADRPGIAVASDFGVTVHRGGETVAAAVPVRVVAAGVRIHRGAQAAVAVEMAGDAVVGAESDPI